MNLKYLLFSVLFYKINSTKIIRNMNIPSCRNCVYFELSPRNTDTISRCSKFGTKNIITDEISNDFADYCRNDENKCGFEGKYFEKETYIKLQIKNANQYLDCNSTPILIFFIFSIYSLWIYHSIKSINH